MKKNIWLTGVLSLLFLMTNLMLKPVFAAWGKKKVEEKKPAEEVLKVEKQESELMVKGKAREALSKKDWVIYSNPLSTKKFRTQTTDVLTFSEGKFISKDLSSQGYPVANYTFTIQEDGTIVWEAMQGNDKVGLAFWRGELKGEVMQGVLSMLPQKGEMEDFVFTSADTR